MWKNIIMGLHGCFAVGEDRLQLQKETESGRERECCNAEGKQEGGF